MNVKITMKNGQSYTINDVLGYKTFRDFSNYLISCTGYAVFEHVTIKIDEIVTIELVKG